MFEKLWQFSSFIVKHGFKVLEAADDSKFDFGDLSKASPEPDKIILRCCASDMPVIMDNVIAVAGKHYTKL